jgi:hypothetical protein
VKIDIFIIIVIEDNQPIHKSVNMIRKRRTSPDFDEKMIFLAKGVHLMEHLIVDI